MPSPATGRAVALLLLAGAATGQLRGTPEVLTDVNGTGPCKVALGALCPSVVLGQGRGAKCLNIKRNRPEAQLSQACKDEILKFYVNASKATSQTNPVNSPEFLKVCKNDIEQICRGQARFQALNCLSKANSESLSPDCKAKVFEIKRHQANVIELDEPFFQSCKEDLSSIKACAALPQFTPAAGRKVCLMQHRRNLTSACKEALFHRVRVDLRDVKLMPAVLAACGTEIKDLCSGRASGEARILKCLWRKRSQASNECRQKVHVVTQTKMSDYRLDYRISTRCEKDIAAHCKAEQERVDSLPASELFGDQWQEGKSGLVLHCLKVSYKNLTEPGCMGEIQRLVRVHAEAPMLDPVFDRKCKADVAKFCNVTKADRLHFCMRNHLSNLSEGCRALEIVQGSVAAMDISMKPAIRNACAQAITKFCSGVSHGDAQIIQCLQDHMDDESMASQCSKVVKDDLEASNHDWRLKFGVHENCLADAGRLCARQVPIAGGAVLMCLKNRINNITGTACRAEIFRYVQQGASNIRFAPGTYAACVKDVKNQCKNILPGQGRVHECLVQHRNNLTRACAETEFKEQKLVSQDIRFHPKARVICKSSMADLCPNIAPGEGRVWECLSKKKGMPKMTPGCLAIVTSHERLQNYEFNLNPQLKKHCSKEASRICPWEASLAEIKEFGHEGAVITCLLSNRDLVETPMCKVVLRTKAVQRLANIENSPDAKTFCQGDIREFCSDVRKNSQEGLVHKCLQDNLKRLSPDCKMVELDIKSMQMEDARLMPFMKKDCLAAQQRYCKDTVTGDGRRIMCMLKNIHKSDMEPECKTHLVQLQRSRSQSLRFNPRLAKQCQRELENLQEKHGGIGHCREQETYDQEVALTASGINCLTSHADEVRTAKCQKALRDILGLQSNDLRAKPGMAKACQQDIRVLCQDTEAGSGRLHDCLRKNFNRIAQSDCKEMVDDVWKAERNDVVLNPKVRNKCQVEMAVFCPNEERGETRVAACLFQHDKLGGFTKGCMDALEDIVPADAFEHGKSMAAAASGTALQDVMMKRNFWDKWGTVLLGGIAFLLAIWIAAVGCIIKLLRSRRSFYGVQVDTPEDGDKIGKTVA